MRALVYGIVAEAIEAAGERLGQALGVSFEPHESSYRGEYLLSRTAGEQELILQENWDPLEGKPMEPQHDAYPFLLYVSTNSAAAVRDRLEPVPGVALLKATP